MWESVNTCQTMERQRPPIKDVHNPASNCTIFDSPRTCACWQFFSSLCGLCVRISYSLLRGFTKSQPSLLSTVVPRISRRFLPRNSQFLSADLRKCTHLVTEDEIRGTDPRVLGTLEQPYAREDSIVYEALARFTRPILSSYLVHPLAGVEIKVSGTHGSVSRWLHTRDARIGSGTNYGGC